MGEGLHFKLSIIANIARLNVRINKDQVPGNNSSYKDEPLLSLLANRVSQLPIISQIGIRSEIKLDKDFVELAR